MTEHRTAASRIPALRVTYVHRVDPQQHACSVCRAPAEFVVGRWDLYRPHLDRLESAQSSYCRLHLDANQRATARPAPQGRAYAEWTKAVHTWMREHVETADRIAEQMVAAKRNLDTGLGFPPDDPRIGPLLEAARATLTEAQRAYHTLTLREEEMDWVHNVRKGDRR